MAVYESEKRPTKTTYIVEAERYNHRQKRTETHRIEVNADTSIKDVLVQIGEFQASMCGGECKIIFVHSLI